MKKFLLACLLMSCAKGFSASNVTKDIETAKDAITYLENHITGLVLDVNVSGLTAEEVGIMDEWLKQDITNITQESLQALETRDEVKQRLADTVDAALKQLDKQSLALQIMLKEIVGLLGPFARIKGQDLTKKQLEDKLRLTIAVIWGQDTDQLEMLSLDSKTKSAFLIWIRLILKSSDSEHSDVKKICGLVRDLQPIVSRLDIYEILLNSLNFIVFN